MKGATKVFRFIGWSILGIIGALIFFILSAIKPINRTNYQEKDFYIKMQENLAQLKGVNIPPAQHNFTVGFAKENITPSYATSMAGSGMRKFQFENVHDSIYVRAIVIGNGSETVSLVSVDLLIVPPAVTKLLEEKLPSIGFSLNNSYLSATHTHSSIGNWGERLAGSFYAGPYDDVLVQFIADKIIACIDAADKNKVRSSLKEGVIPVSDLLYNRLARESGKIDSLMRLIEVDRVDGKRLILTTFTGHPTCDKSSSRNVSRDYPGVLVDKLEQGGYTFAMFMAGAVGSHSCEGPPRGEERINFVGERLATLTFQQKDSLKPISDSTMIMVRVPLSLGKPQMRITKDWCIRPWLFKSAFGLYPSSLTALRIGNVVMLGTPCDFSGELTTSLDSVAARHNLKAMVTSFNGSYMGYVTLDKHYDIDHYETRIMNWYGTGNGAYLSECLMTMLDVVSDKAVNSHQ